MGLRGRDVYSPAVLWLASVKVSLPGFALKERELKAGLVAINISLLWRENEFNCRTD